MNQEHVAELQNALSYAREMEKISFELAQAVSTMEQYKELCDRYTGGINGFFGHYSGYDVEETINKLQGFYEISQKVTNQIEVLESQIEDSAVISSIDEIKVGMVIRAIKSFDTADHRVIKFGLGCKCATSVERQWVAMSGKIGSEWTVLEKDSQGVLVGDGKNTERLIYIDKELLVERFAITKKRFNQLHRVELMVDEFDTFNITKVELINGDKILTSISNRKMELEIIGQILVSYFDEHIDPTEIRVESSTWKMHGNNVQASFLKKGNYFQYSKEHSELIDGRLPRGLFKPSGKRIMTIMSIKEVN